MFAWLHNAPVVADRSAPIHSVVMRQARVYGHRREDTNPCVGIKRYHRQGRERFLSAAEVRRLGEVLTPREADHPQKVAIIRLLLLTGCRKGEIVSLKWSFSRERKLFLRRSKVGPRTVWRSSATRAILDGLPRAATWIFPSPRTDCQLNGETVRPYDVALEPRQTSAMSASMTSGTSSPATLFCVLQGVPLPVVSRMLGHKRPSMTLR